MDELCLVFDKSDVIIIKHIKNKLRKSLIDYDLIVVEVEMNGYIHLLVSYKTIYKRRIKCQLRSIICDTICYFFKKEYLIHNLYSFTNLMNREALLYALIYFDLDTDVYIISKIIKDINTLNIRSLYNFKLKPLRDKWFELVKISNDNRLYLSTNSAILDFIKFLIENLTIKVETLNVVEKSIGKYAFYDDNLNELEIDFVNENLSLLSMLISQNAKKINIYYAEGASTESLKGLQYIYNKRINFYSNKEFLETY